MRFSRSPAAVAKLILPPRGTKSLALLQQRMMSTFKFGPFEVAGEVFIKTAHSFGFVNLKPLLPGHVLVCPLKPYRRLTDVPPAEVAELFFTVQIVQRLLAKGYFPKDTDISTGGSFNVAVQDGEEAGQTVPHLHVHIIPRTRGDLERSDDIYDGMTGEPGNVGGAFWNRERPKPGGAMPKIEDEDRKARSKDDMNEEARRYRRALEEEGIEWTE